MVIKVSENDIRKSLSGRAKLPHAMRGAWRSWRGLANSVQLEFKPFNTFLRNRTSMAHEHSRYSRAAPGASAFKRSEPISGTNCPTGRVFRSKPSHPTLPTLFARNTEAVAGRVIEQ